jgi:D-arabinose 1-dehydrogenase-like Zn-dependent alcohol dehydrogenase
MGSAAELAALLEFMVARNLRPVIDSVYGFTAVADAFARLESGAVFGKVVIDHLH